MDKLPYCGYCGETIHNWHKVKYGKDIEEALNLKIVEAVTKHFKNIFVKFIVLFRLIPILEWNTKWYFCNQNCKDSFAKKLGLKKKPTNTHTL